jgi:hypothetical protein
MRSFVLSLSLALLAGPAIAQSVTLKGAEGQTATVTAADLAALPQVTLAFDAHGDRHIYSGPLLIDVLAKVGAPSGKALHGAELAKAVTVTAADGYRVVFGLAEADPGTRPNRIILADRADGAPLGPKDGPFKIVAEGDLRPARGVRMVRAIAVVNLDAAATQGAR